MFVVWEACVHPSAQQFPNSCHALRNAHKAAFNPLLTCAQDGAWRVGEGVCCLTTPTHAYIARLKPSSGDLVMLFSIPQPHPGAQQQAVPVAAWLPHSRWAVASRQHCVPAHSSTRQYAPSSRGFRT